MSYFNFCKCATSDITSAQLQFRRQRIKELVQAIKNSSISIAEDETFVNSANTMVVFSKDSVCRYSCAPEDTVYDYADLDKM